MAIAIVACSTEIDPAVELAATEGAMRLGVAFQQSATVDEEVVIKIYKVEGEELNLVRRYTSLNDVPQYLALLAGDYVAKVQVGEKHIVSFDEKYYLGEQSFTVTAGNVTPVTVDCKIQSTVVRIEYDTTVAEKLNAGYFTNVSVAESYNPTAIASGDVHSLRYEQTKEGYFVLPADQTTLFWHFEGEHPVEGAIMKEAKIENVKPAVRYTVKLKYSKDAPGGIIIEAIVDESIEKVDDTLIFSPDPTVMGDGFNEKDQQLSIVTRTYNVASLANINKLAIEADDVEHDILSGNVAGVNVVKIDELNYKVTVAPEFFVNVSGGENAISFIIEDTDGGKAKKDIQYNVQGIMPLTINDYNLWTGKATFKANIIDTTATSVKVAYSTNGTTWTEVEATANDGYYTATSVGFTADKNYSYKLIVDGVDSGKALLVATAAGAQLPNSDFESWSDSKNAAGLWSSGNNTFVTLMKQASGRNGGYCAYLDSQDAVGKFAAGNLFTGSFEMNISTMSGKVTFGKDFKFNAKPESLSFWMKNTQGQINYGDKGSGTDKYTAMVLITDGTTYTVDTTDENSFLIFDTLGSKPGIIAYGYINSDDSNADWVEKTVQLTYVAGYEQMTPKKISVSFTPSGFGDYWCGSTDSEMYVDDVRLNY